MVNAIFPFLPHQCFTMAFNFQLKVQQMKTNECLQEAGAIKWYLIIFYFDKRASLIPSHCLRSEEDPRTQQIMLPLWILCLWSCALLPRGKSQIKEIEKAAGGWNTHRRLVQKTPQTDTLWSIKVMPGQPNNARQLWNIIALHLVIKLFTTVVSRKKWVVVAH